MKNILGLAVLLVASSAFAGWDGTATCTGTYQSKIVKITTTFNGYSNRLDDENKFKLTVNGKKVDASYDHLTDFYVSSEQIRSKSQTIILGLSNDGGETVFAVESMGAGNANNIFKIQGRLVGTKSFDLVSLKNIDCTSKIVENID